MTNSKCPHDDCHLRNENGYCKVTACVNPRYKNENIICGCVMKPEPAIDVPPTRTCAICGKKEFENAIIRKIDFWLCDDCLGRLKSTLYPVIEFGVCDQDEIQHVGYDDMQLGREK